MTEDGLLNSCNETELLDMARRQGLGVLRRGIPFPELVAIIKGEVLPRPEYVSGTMHTRRILQEYVSKNIERIRSQLPGCNGQCTTYPCSEGRHALCFAPNETVVR